MRKVVPLLAALVFAVLAVPGRAQRAPAAASKASNAGATTTGLNRAGQAQTANPTGMASKGLATATKHAAPQAGGQGLGASQKTGLNRAAQAQAANPTGMGSTGLATATKNAAPQAGGQGLGASHATISKSHSRKR